MASPTRIKTKTLGDWASLAIKKHLQKVIKHEEDVLHDQDPEALHQMRVGMRRLRSAIKGFAPALLLPKPAQDEKIGKIAHQLGSLRDLDVLRETLQTRHKPTLPPEEQEALETALARLGQQRRQTSAAVQKTLERQRYNNLKQSLKKWLKQPTYQEIAQMPIQEVLPDLLLPEVSRFLLHPGWLVGTTFKQGINFQELDAATVQRLAAQGPLLHSLRKETKRVRYQMELFTDFYGQPFAAYVEDVKTIQEILGQIQDNLVLSQFLTDVLGSKVKSVLPTLTEQLAQMDYQAWQQWQPIQQRFLTPETRQGLHLAILQPITG